MQKLSRPSIFSTVVVSSTKESSKSEMGPVCNQCAALGNELMNAATSFHKLHLKVTGLGSYAAHKALNKLYDALPGHADDLIEGYQGASEMILDIPDTTTRKLNSVEDGLSYLRELTTQVNSLQEVMPYSEIVNDLDTIKSTINSIKYKLLFIK